MDVVKFVRHLCRLVLRHQMPVWNYFVNSFYSVSAGEHLPATQRRKTKRAGKKGASVATGAKEDDSKKSEPLQIYSFCRLSGFSLLFCIVEPSC
jgi:hypothetical protein